MNIEEKVDNHYGRNYYYVGEFNNGTDDRDGIGITVFDIGYTHNNLIIIYQYKLYLWRILKG